jgi:hypothetical protein
MGLTMAPATDSIMGSVPRERAGVGSAVNDTTRQTGGALGVAVLGSVLATRYNARLDAVALPRSVATAAHESVGAALKIASHLPAPAGPALAAAARAGFTSGVTLATGVGTAVVVGAAVVVVAFLPNRSPDQASERAAAQGRGPALPGPGTSTTPGDLADVVGEHRGPRV